MSVHILLINHRFMIYVMASLIISLHQIKKVMKSKDCLEAQCSEKSYCSTLSGHKRAQHQSAVEPANV